MTLNEEIKQIEIKVKRGRSSDHRWSDNEYQVAVICYFLNKNKEDREYMVSSLNRKNPQYKELTNDSLGIAIGNVKAHFENGKLNKGALRLKEIANIYSRRKFSNVDLRLILGYILN